MAVPVASTQVSDDVGIDVLLNGGGIAHLRLVQARDEQALLGLNARVSLRTRRLRYFSASDRPGDWYVEQLLKEAVLGCALIAEVGGVLVAVGSFTRLERDPQLADLGLLVDDAHQHQGLGVLLLEHLAGLARHQGITALVADVLAENTPMLHLLRSSGFRTESTSHREVVELRIDLDEGHALTQAVTQREVVAERASLRPLLQPTGIAVVGSLRHGGVASEVWRSLHDSGYAGTLRRVGPGQDIGDGPPVDLAVIAVPAGRVLAVAEQAAAAGARALCVLSAGFAEAGDEGKARQQALLSLCRRATVRLVGPNCLGLVSTDPAHGFNATFCDARPRRGGIALISQSGAIGIAALRHAERRGAGLSAFVSTGNKADVSGNDLLAWFSDDPATTAVAMYLESFGNARKFARMAEAVGRTKPVVVVKAGRSPAGARAGQSHTAAAATPDVAIDALLRSCGVIRVDGLSDLFDVLSLLDGAALPRGERIAVLGNSGGPGVLAADACVAAGLVLADLSEDTLAVLRHVAPEGASLLNPVDLLATVPAEAFERALLALANDPGVDAVVTVYTPLMHGSEEAFAAAVNRVHRAHQDLCVIATFPGCSTAPGTLTRGVPFFELPEDAIAALGRVVAHVSWRTRATAQREDHALPDAAPVRAALGRALDDQPRWLSPAEATTLLEQLQVPCLPGVEVHDVQAAVTAASDLGYPVVLKAYGQGLVHKSRQGAVLLDLRTEEALVRGYDELVHRVGDSADGVLVQPMVATPAGSELLVGLARDPDVGPLVAVGAGGSLTDLLDDRVVALPPRDEQAALELLAGLRCAPALAASGDWPGPGVRAAAQVLLAVAALARSVPEVLELDVNPLVLTPTGVLAVDVKVRVAPDAQPTGFAQRDLSPSPQPRSSS